MKTKVMGILNVTPDSFYDGVRNLKFEAVLQKARKMVEDGADIIDVGGESTRPFAEPVSLNEECDRVLPVIERLVKECSVPLSIDTRHAEVMDEAIKMGASIINDVNALQAPGAMDVAARHQVTVCLMHMQGTPETMQLNPHYENVTNDVFHFLEQRIHACEKAGIKKQNIWIDPGIGFGKTLDHNLALIGQLPAFKKLNCPILVGLSRKSMFQALLDLPVEERLPASLAGAVLAARQGAAIIRTHDVRPTRECLKVVEAVSPHWREETYVV